MEEYMTDRNTKEFEQLTIDEAAFLKEIEADQSEDDEEDFDAIVRNLKKPERLEQNATRMERDTTDSEKCVELREIPAVVDDFFRNFLIRMGMKSTLQLFNHEWYELDSKGLINDDNAKLVPDIYLQNQMLDDQVCRLQSELAEAREITLKAKETWITFRKQRDLHKMHHYRVLQEKETLATKTKRLEKHNKSLEPLLQELKTKYESCTKEKTLIRLDRDRYISRVEALEQELRSVRGEDQINPNRTLKGDKANKKETKKHNLNKPKEVVGRKNTVSEHKIPSQDHDNPLRATEYTKVDIKNVSDIKTCPSHSNAVAAVTFHPSNPVLATASDDESWKLWSVPGCELVMSGGHQSWIAGIAFHPRGAHLATSSGDNTVKIWDFINASCATTLSDHSHPVWESTFHHEGDFLVSASMDQTCKLWDISTGKCRKTFRGHVDSVNSVCFQPYCCNFCTASGDKTISIWDIRSGLCVQTFYGHQNAVNSVTFALKGDVIASCDSDGVVKTWDTRMIAERGTLATGRHPLNSVAFDQSGQVVAAASDDSTIKLVDFEVKNEQETPQMIDLKGHEGPVQSVQFDSLGHLLASTSSDCSFKLWAL
uniref:Flagellar protein putative n=1 Tax=Albugo laibachii Nc14 TaxID=890382 RepID=F0W521_9STRA|nr:flagellar protein putative [Albugo laibachii Nc14]|eukprot:CCA16212.1 flagellar protein putative [Albugo laibachii Nc14]